MKQNIFKVLAACFCLFLLPLNLVAMGRADVPDNGKKNIAVTFNALQEITKAIAKDKVNISVIIPPGMEPHDFEPKAKDLAFLSKADAVIYNGLGMEPWLAASLRAVKNDSIIQIETSKGINPIKAAHHSHPGICNHGEWDPHVWLSPSSAKIIVKNIQEGLSKIDGENAEFYKANAEAYIAELDSLLKEYTAKFSGARNKHFITGHAAFAYFCRDFGLEQKSVTGVFDEGEPNAKNLADLVEYCKNNDIHTVFTEEAASPEVSRTLAKEVNGKVEKIYTMESPEDGKTYLERLASNLIKVYENLK